MSMIRPYIWLVAVVAILAAAPAARAQHYEPFIDPGYFGQPDFQFFAPPEVSDFSGGEPANTGVYATYDRTFVNVSRPQQFDNSSPFIQYNTKGQGDFTWGNRFEIGYMTEERSGWQGVFWHVNGPNETIVVGEDESTVNVSVGGANTVLEILSPVAINSINVFKMSSFELNKVWRRKEFHNGAVLEPLLGFRYINARDFFQQQTFNEIPLPPTTPPTFRLTTTDAAIFENQCVGGQLGGRLFRQRGHWLLSADLRFFALANFQSLTSTNTVSLLPDPQYVNPGNVVVVAQDIARSRIYDRNSELVWGGEVRGEAAYELTRDISLRFGFVFLDLGQGIGRGPDIKYDNQSVQMAGLTFGLTINR
jgi:Putative beta barrel porin-7 (BBP7)